MIRPRWTITQPTMGLGSTLPRPRAASSMARRMKLSSKLFSSVCIGVHLWFGRLDRDVLRFAAGVKQAVEDHQADAGAEEDIGDIENPGEQSRPDGPLQPASLRPR